MKNKKILITGCAGFIGSNLSDVLLTNNQVIGIDNLSTGQEKFMSSSIKNKNFTFHKFDLLDKASLIDVSKNIDIVIHLAANADVRDGINKPTIDLEQNTIVTSNVLESCRINNIKEFMFSSTGSIYGNHKTIPTPEDAQFPIQTSLYGASKLACEGMISAYSEAYRIKSWMFRFVSIVGERYSHGHIFDFYKQLSKNPEELFVLGDGNQKKSYLYIQDCLNAIIHSYSNISNEINIINLGYDDYITVKDSIGFICEELSLEPNLKFAGGESGWVGDNPYIHLDTNKITKSGWNPKLSIKEGVQRTVRYLQTNEWLFKKR